MAEEGGEGSDGGGDEEVVDEQPGRQGADGKLDPRAKKRQLWFFFKPDNDFFLQPCGY